jgi:hypothetical protein
MGDPTSDIDAMRAQLFAGTADKPQMCEILDVSERTLERYVAAGLPFCRLGNQRRFPIQQGRDWLLNNVRSRAPRRRGRPPTRGL